MAQGSSRVFVVRASLVVIHPHALMCLFEVTIREMGNVELFELCETIPKVQCSECLLYWNQGVIYCTCGHLRNSCEKRR